MAKIHIENGIISSSADYGLYHGTSEIAKVEAGGLRVQGDVTAENLIVSSSVTFMTQSFSSGSTIFGDTGDDTHQFTGSLKIQSGSIDVTSTQSPNYGMRFATSAGLQYFKIRNGNSETFPYGQIILNYSNNSSYYSFINMAGSHNLKITAGTSTSLGSLSINAHTAQIANFHGTNGLTVNVGNISGSSTSTGSFGTLQVKGSPLINGNSTGIGIGSGASAVSPNHPFVVSNGASSAAKFIGNAGQVSLTLVPNEGGTSTSLVALSTIFSIRPGGTNVLNALSSGRVGIGTTSPDYELDIEGTGDVESRVKSTSGGRARFRLDANANIAEIYFADNGTNRNAIWNAFNGDDSLNFYSFQLGSDAANQTAKMHNNGTYGGNWDFYYNVSGSSTSTGSFGAGYIDNKLGIGTTSPSEKLHVSEGEIKIEHSTTGRMVIQGGTRADVIMTDTGGGGNTKKIQMVQEADAFKIRSLTDAGDVGTERMHFDLTNNRIGIGTTSPGQTLHVAGNGLFTGTLYVGTTVQSYNGDLYLKSNNGETEIFLDNDDVITFKTSNSERLRITDTLISGSSTSTGSFGAVKVQGSPLITGDSDSVIIGDYSKGNTNLLIRSNGASTTTGIRIERGSSGNNFLLTNDGSFNLERDGIGDLMKVSFTGTFQFPQANTKISGSSTSTGSFGNGFFADTLRVNSTDTSATPLFIKSTGTDTAVFNIDASDGIDLFRVDEDSNGNSKVVMRDTSGNADIQLHTGTHTHFNNNGNFGIGTTSPGAKLTVHGDISGSSTSTGSFGRLELAGKSSTNSTISVQDGVNNGILRLQGSTRVASPGSYIQLYGPNGSHGSAVFNYGYAPGNSTLSFTVDGNEKIEFHGTGTITTQGNLISQELNGLISGSSTSTGSFGTIQTTTGTIPTLFGNTEINGVGITASSNTRIISKDNSSADFTIRNTGQNRHIYFNVNSAGSQVNALQINGLTKHLYSFYGINSMSGNQLYLNADSTSILFSVGGATKMTMDASGNLSTDGNVSGSSTSTGSFGKIVAKERISIFSGLTIQNEAALSIYSDNRKAIHIDHDDADEPAVYIDTTNSADKALEIYSNAAATTNPLVSVIAENASMDNELIHLRQDGNNGAITITNNGTGDGIVYTGGQHAISGSSTSTGSFGMASVGRLDVRSDYSAAGFNITGDQIRSNNGLILLNNQGSTGVYFYNGVFLGGNYNVVQLTVRANSSQTANIQEWHDSSNNFLAGITPSGDISGSSTSTGSFGSLVVADAVQGDTTFRGDIVVPTDASSVSHKIKLTGDSTHEIYSNSYNLIYDANVGHTFDSAGSNSFTGGAGTIEIKHSTSQRYIQPSFTGFNINASHDGGFGFVTVGSTTTYTAIEPVYGDNNTSGLKFNSRTGGTNTERLRITSDGQISGSSTSTGSFGNVHVASKLAIQTTTPRGPIDVLGSAGSQGFYVSTYGTAVYLPTDIAHSGGGGTFDLQPRNFRLGTSTGGPVSIYPRFNAQLNLGTTDDTDLLTLSGSTQISGSAISTGSFGHGHFASKLGIGTTSPNHALDVFGVGRFRASQTTDQLRLTDTTNDTNASFRTTNGTLYIKPNGSDIKVSIFSNGKFGLGTSSPSALIHGTGDQATTLRLQNTSSALNYILLNNSTSANNYIQTNGYGIQLNADANGSNGTVDLMTNNTLALRVDNSQNIKITDTKNLGTSTFVSGITGDGFRISDGGSDGVSMEIDNIFVRNTLRTHIFQKDVVKATNGILYISDSGVISGSNGTNTVTFLNSKSATFADNTRLWYKDAREDDGTVVSVQFDINDASPTDAGGATTYTVDNVVGSLGDVTGSLGNSGGTAVRISGGSILLDASSANFPFMDVNANSGSAVMRMGYLGGITSPKLGSLSGFGIWASGSAFFEGKINATAGGFIAGWSLNTSTIEKIDDDGGVKIDSTNKRIDFLSDASTTRLRVGQVDSNKFGMRGFNDGGNRVFEISEVRNEIAGWSIQETVISSSAGNMHIDSGNSRFLVNDPSGQQRVRMGLLNSSNQYGISGSDSAGNLLFKLGEAGNEIAGWGITQTVISSSDGNVQIDSGNSRFLIKSGSGERVRMGLLNNNSQYGISGSDENGNLLFKLGDAGNEIAGWRIAQGKLDFDHPTGSIAIDASNKNIAIYTGSINAARPKVVMGNLPTTGDQRYGFAVFSGSGNADISDDDSYSVLITKDKARLAGWDLVPGRLRSGTVADINGNQAKIALGLNAHQVHSTPQPSLFYVSASSNPTFFVGENFSYVNDVLTAAGWKISKGQISSSNGQAILSGSGVLSLGSGTHDYDQPNRIYIDPNTDGGRMSIGRGFKYTGDALTVGGWTINNTTITGGQTTLNSSGIISVGNLANASTTVTEKYGFLADSSGNVLIKGEDSDTNYIKFDVDGAGSALQIKTANFEVVGGNVTMAGTVTAAAGQIGGFTIANNQLTGSGTALIATNTGTDRIEIRSADNTLVFLEGTKNLASPIFFLGKTAGDPSGLGTGTTGNINRYGPRASGSTGAISNQNNLGQVRVQNPDIMAGTGMSAVGLPGRFYYQYSNVWSTLDMGTSAGSISGLKGRASIWGETRQKAPTAGSQNTSGLLVGVGGAHHDNNLSYRWNLSTGLLGVSSPHYANFTSANLPTGSGVPITSAYSEGSYGLVSLGDVYSTGSFVLRDGPLVVSASTDGEFGGGESGVIIDSSNVANQEAALTFKNDAQTFIMGVDNDDVFKIYDGTALPSGNTTNQSICIAGNFMYLTAGSILLQGGYASTGININSAGDILSAGYATFDGGVHVGGTSDPGNDNLLVDGNITANGNIIGDGSTAISSMASLGIGSVTATGTIQAVNLIANGNTDLGNQTTDTITFTGRVDSSILPSASATYDLGGTSNRWNNIYTTDLQLSNIDKDKGNDVDGTRGDWTLQEGDENLYVINNISGKKYKIALIPMDDKDE